MSTEIEQPAARGPKPQWRLDADTGSLVPRSALDVLVDLNDRIVSGNLSDYQAIPLGFTPLDKTIGTGLRPGELLLIGGAQGTGKTTMALQMARNVASGGQANVLYICFEHEEHYLLNRLIAMESALAHLPHKTGAIKIQDVRREILGGITTFVTMAYIIVVNPAILSAAGIPVGPSTVATILAAVRCRCLARSSSSFRAISIALRVKPSMP